MQPTLFLPHGAPDLALADIPAAAFLRGAFQTLERPKGIVIISAHWETAGTEITTAPALPTIYDFGGFSDALYALKYSAKTAPWLIDAVIDSLRGNGFPVTSNPARGLDHGAWIPLRLALPEADIPVVQLSLSRAHTPQMHFAFGQALSSLSAQDILVIGSGALVHNLREIRPEGTPPPAWAIAFDAWVDAALICQDWPALFAFNQSAPGRQSHPSPEHFLPLLVAVGAAAGHSGHLHMRKIHNSYSYGSIGMSAWEFSHGT